MAELLSHVDKDVASLGANIKARYSPGMNNRSDATSSSENLMRIARNAFENLPDNLRQAAGHVVILVEEIPDESIVRDLELDSPLDLLGLYDGVSMLDKSVLDTPTAPDTVTLFRLPILDYWQSGNESLEHLVRHILIHEIGHHFGFSDEDMERIENMR